MPKDSVLRCKVKATIDGQTDWMIIDAIEEDNSYSLVLEWEKKSGEDTEFPKKRVGIQKDCFKVISDATCGFELECRYRIDFDQIPFTEVIVDDAEELWRRGENLFYPRPADENP